MSNREKSKEDKYLFLPLSHIPYLLGLSYFLGFVVIAYRLRNYGIVPTDLFEAQYLSAGLIPTAILFLIYWSVRFTWHSYEIPDELHGLLRWLEKHHVRLLVGWALAVIVISYYLENFFLSYSIFTILYTIVIGFAICALSVIIFHIRKQYNNPNYLHGVIASNTMRRKYLVIFSLVFSIGVFFSTLVNIASYFSELYLKVPQSYGGMDTTIIQLIMSKDQIPPDLRETATSDSNQYFLTRPLQLAYRSQSGYVLFDGLTNTVWSVPTSVVSGSISFDLENLKNTLIQHFNMPLGQLEFVIIHLSDKLAIGEMVNGYFLAAFVRDEWIIVYFGSDLPACNIVDEHIFPVEWVPQCHDNSNIVIDR